MDFGQFIRNKIFFLSVSILLTGCSVGSGNQNSELALVAVAAVASNPEAVESTATSTSTSTTTNSSGTGSSSTSSSATSTSTSSSTTGSSKTVYISGNLYESINSDQSNNQAPGALENYTITKTMSGSASSVRYAPGASIVRQESAGTDSTSVTTDHLGSYEFALDGDPGTYTFQVQDESGTDLGSFSIATTSDGSMDLTTGVQITGSGFTTSVPLVDEEAPVDSVASNPCSTFPSGTTTMQKEILEVIHRKALEKLYKNSESIKVKGLNDVYRASTTGSGGGTAELIIIMDEVASGADYAPESPGTQYPWSGKPSEGGNDHPGAISDTGIGHEKLYLVKYQNYTEDGITINGTIAFIYGYRYYSSSQSGYLFETDANAWGSSGGYWATNNPSSWSHISKTQELVDYFAYRSQPHILPGRSVIKTILDDLRSWWSYPETGVPGGANWNPVNVLKVTGNYSDTVKVSFDILNQKTAQTKKGLSATEAASTYALKDELEFSYQFTSGGSVTMTERTGPGIYKQTYTDLMNSYAAIPRTGNESQNYTINGPSGGTAEFSVRKAAITGGFSVQETHTFKNYAANGILLNGSYSFIYKTNESGQFVEKEVSGGVVNISGYFTGQARHRFIVWHNGTNFQLTNWYFVGDYPAGWDRVTVVLPVSFGE